MFCKFLKSVSAGLPRLSSRAYSTGEFLCFCEWVCLCYSGSFFPDCQESRCFSWNTRAARIHAASRFVSELSAAASPGVLFLYFSFPVAGKDGAVFVRQIHNFLFASPRVEEFLIFVFLISSHPLWKYFPQRLKIKSYLNAGNCLQCLTSSNRNHCIPGTV